MILKKGDMDHWPSSLPAGILWSYNGCLLDGADLDNLSLEYLLPALLEVHLESCEFPVSPDAGDNLPRDLIPSTRFWYSFELRVGDGDNLPLDLVVSPCWLLSQPVNSIPINLGV